MKQLAPEDIRRPRNVSGYAHVGRVAGPSRGSSPAYYQAYERGGRGGDWKGPARKHPDEAAQDYCDYVNGNGIAQPARLNTAGHGGSREALPRDPEVEAALGVLRDARAQRRGVQGYVYLIGIKGDLSAVKIGYSTNPSKRVGELQTGNPHLLILLASKEATEEEEKTLHERHITTNLIGEWFRPTKELLSEFGLSKYDLLRRCGGTLRSVA
jgi:hypothetical protein